MFHRWRKKQHHREWTNTCFNRNFDSNLPSQFSVFAGALFCRSPTLDTPGSVSPQPPFIHTLGSSTFCPTSWTPFKNIELSNLLMRGGCNFFLFAGRGRTFFCLLTAISHVAQTPGVIYFSHIKRYIPYARCLCHVASVFERGRVGGQHLPKILIRGPWRGGGSIPLMALVSLLIYFQGLFFTIKSAIYNYFISSESMTGTYALIHNLTMHCMVSSFAWIIVHMNVL